MAKILPGAIATAISGTIAGTTYSNYRGMLVARKKPVPGKTLTARQMFIGSLMSLLSRAWRDDLNQGLRTAWNQRAKNYPWVNVFGNELKMTGENLYIKQNMVLLDHGLARQDTPAPNVEPAELTDVTSVVNPSGSLDIFVPSVDAAVITAQAPFIDIFVAGGFLLVDDSGLPADIQVDTQGLPAGRVQQKSDLRHAAYFDQADVITEAQTAISVLPPVGTTKNLVIILRKYNKFGNFSAPRTFEGIVTRP